jgi:hypothetical protein
MFHDILSTIDSQIRFNYLCFIWSLTCLQGMFHWTMQSIQHMRPPWYPDTHSFHLPKRWTVILLVIRNKFTTLPTFLTCIEHVLQARDAWIQATKPNYPCRMRIVDDELCPTCDSCGVSMSFIYLYVSKQHNTMANCCADVLCIAHCSVHAGNTQGSSTYDLCGNCYLQLPLGNHSMPSVDMVVMPNANSLDDTVEKAKVRFWHYVTLYIDLMVVRYLWGRQHRWGLGIFMFA